MTVHVMVGTGIGMTDAALLLLLDALHHRRSGEYLLVMFRAHLNCQIFRRPSPTYETPVDEPYNPDEPKEDDSEARSVFVSQLAARLTARDLGYFFEEKLGENTVMDSRIVTDRLSRRSKGCVPSHSPLQV